MIKSNKLGTSWFSMYHALHMNCTVAKVYTVLLRNVLTIEKGNAKEGQLFYSKKQNKKNRESHYRDYH